MDIIYGYGGAAVITATCYYHHEGSLVSGLRNVLLTASLSLVVFSSQCLTSLSNANAQSVRASVPFTSPGAKASSDYIGRYTDGAAYVVYFESTKYGMTLRPALWTATQLLRENGKDEFVVVDRPERRAVFQRDDSGRVVTVTIQGMEGEGQPLERAKPELFPVELLLSGRGRAAARSQLANSSVDIITATRLAERVLSRFPSKAGAVADFLSEIGSRFPGTASIQSLLGYAYVWASDRKSALLSFRRAHLLDPTNRDVISGLARLQALPSSVTKEDAGWELPFTLSAVFEKPTAAEIRAVEDDWRTRDLTPKDVQEVAKGRIDLGQSSAIVRIVSHRVHGSRHYGAIIIPATAKPGCCPVLIEAKGVSPSYFPLDLTKLHSIAFMGDRQRQLIYVVPTYRGEILNFDGVTYQSEGDRTDAWDGAADDAIALLNVALQTTPEADASRIAAFGQSRGGTIALLLGIRDRRVRYVVDSAGPTDWFELMGTAGWSQQEIFGEGLRTRANPEETGGQLIEHFLLKAIHGEENLQAVRHRMLAGSPLYFAGRLPRLQLHYGYEDPSVPIRNGLQLVSELRRQGVPATRYQGHFYPGQGHDTDRIVAPALTHEFLTKVLFSKRRKGKSPKVVR